MKLRRQVIAAIFQRNFSAYFSGMLGYLFIIVFVVACGWYAFDGRFFTANEPNLDQLSINYPMLMLFFIPAIAMGVWAEERKTGTDELLFTMPATDIEILLGKYLSVTAVYTVALLFSMTHVLVLMYLGNPDIGLIATTYFGYWIAGAALLSAGMLASQFTNNMTGAFVLGMVITAIPVFIGQVARFIGLGNRLDGFSLEEQFRDLGMGIIPLTSLIYFVGCTVVMLYLNLVMMSRRHWKSGDEKNAAGQFTVRAISIGVIVACVTAWAGYTGSRFDMTSEKLYSLSGSTRGILNSLESERPIEIQAFLTPQDSTPSDYVETRKRLVGLLRQFDKLGGANLEVRYVDVEPFTTQAEEAERFGIDAVRVATEEDGRRGEQQVYLGAVVISSYDKVVVPFFGKGLPIEYELTRSVQTVADDSRYTVGVLQTDADLMGQREWRIISELKKQYNVESVSPASPIDPSGFDVLLAAMPSSLTAPEMTNLVNYANTGSPLLVFDDPFPLSFNTGFGVTGAPRQPKPSAGGGGMMGGGSPPPEPKADNGQATSLMRALGVQWGHDSVVFDVSNPHPEFALLPDEYVFVTRGGSNPKSFNTDSNITSGLQEMIMLYSGSINKSSESNSDFTPLLQTGLESGRLRWEEFVDDGGFNFLSMQSAANPRRDPLRRIDSKKYTLAAQVKSESGDTPVNAIFCSDIDMISDFFFEERNLGNLNISFDNVTFVLNAVDALAGDESFIELRSRRPKHRTLVRVEGNKREFYEEANEAELDADKAAEEELAARRKQLQERVTEIEEDADLDPIAKSQMLRQAQEAEQQRLNLAEAKIEQNKNDVVRKIRAKTNTQIKSLESFIRLWAVWLPAVPALVVGLSVFLSKIKDEKKQVSSKRRRDE